MGFALVRAMSARRCIMDRTDIEAAHALIGDRFTLNYLGRSLRLRPGDQVEFFDGQGVARTAEIETVENNQIKGLWREPIRQENRRLESAPVPIIARLKSHAEDDAISALSAIGFPQIRIFRADRDATDKPWSEKQAQRWRRIADDSCRQSGGYWRTDIEVCDHLERAIEGLSGLAYGDPMGRSLSGFSQSSLGVVIGPEGGLSAEEKRLLTDSNAHAVQLGSRVLRARHAASLLPVVALSHWQASL